MKVDVLIIGGGPAGLSAAVETARRGLRTIVCDDKLTAGGQLVKQIHRFFGSSRHQAGSRGRDIAADLTEAAVRSGAELWLDSTVYAITDREVRVVRGMLSGRAKVCSVNARAVIIAAGAVENSVQFPGWTLPGVMGVGAAQTLANQHRVLPGKRILIVGSGNVGLIVSYQLAQAGADIAAVIDLLPDVGGYKVHGARIRRMGIPIWMRTTIVSAYGDQEVAGAVVTPVDDAGQPVMADAREVDVDTVCIAAGMRPYARLAWLAGCKGVYVVVLGGWLPWHDAEMRTSVPGVFIAGDTAGVEEASVALDEGRLAGLSAARMLGRDVNDQIDQVRQGLAVFRSGLYADRGRAKIELSRSRPVPMVEGGGCDG